MIVNGISMKLESTGQEQFDHPDLHFMIELILW